MGARSAGPVRCNTAVGQLATQILPVKGNAASHAPRARFRHTLRHRRYTRSLYRSLAVVVIGWHGRTDQLPPPLPGLG